MSISTTLNLCERLCVNTGRQSWPAWLSLVLVAATGLSAAAPPTNAAAVTSAPPAAEAAPLPAEPAPPRAETPPSRASSAPQKLDESAFAMIAERNIFNANRSGGRVTVGTSRRQPRIETFTLVGTMAYEKGAFAFFEGSSSEFTKVLKPASTIAGYKLADIYAGSVRLEADGKQFDLPVGSQMRREDAGAWKVGEATGSSGSTARNGNGEASSAASRRNRDSFSRRSNTTEPAGKAPASASPTAAEQSEILKKLMERREKE